MNQLLASFLRNDNNPGLATAGVLAGGLFNIFGDYVFVFTLDLGMFGAGLATAYAAAHENAVKMRQMHDKLVSDIETLNARREMVKAKVAVAKTQQKVNQVSSASDKAAGAMSAFDRMEDKANRMLDEANAMAELNTEPVDEAKALEAKYNAAGTDASVDDELEKMKKELGL